MTPEERSLLERTYKIAEENNAILRGIRRANRFSLALRIAYWVLIVGVAVGAFYFIQPYLESTLDLFDQAQDSIKSINGTIDNVQGLLR